MIQNFSFENGLDDDDDEIVLTRTRRNPLVSKVLELVNGNGISMSMVFFLDYVKNDEAGDGDCELESVIHDVCSVQESHVHDFRFLTLNANETETLNLIEDSSSVFSLSPHHFLV
jgi:hypothetical protein